VLVYAGSSHTALVEATCARLGCPPGRLRRVRFSNDCIKVQVEDAVRDEDVFVVQTGAAPLSDHLIELFILLDALRTASARRITVALPYYPYVRSDKKDEPGVSIAARLMADLLATSGADRVLVLDLHAPQVQGFFRIPADHGTSVPLLAEAVRQLVPLERLTVVAPDAGAAKLAERYAKLLGAEIAILEKARSGDDESARAVRMVGDVSGRDALVVDDEVSTGGTLVEAVELLHARGARKVFASIVHGCLVGPALERLSASRLERLITTDTLPPKQHPKVHAVTIAPLLAELIGRMHRGASIDDLWA